MTSFRAITDADLDFLRELYASTRQDEMAAVPWDAVQKSAFLNMQFEAQHKYYQQQFPAAQFDLVVEDGRPIGRLYLDRRVNEHRLIDIALMPECRGRGLGSRLMHDVLAEAASAGKRVCIHVEHNNPAMRLYERLGFERLEEQGVYYLMEWRPPTVAAAAQGGA